MVAVLPLSLAMRDVMLAAGLGFLLGLLYRFMRLPLGGARWACFMCDVIICAVGALLYRSAAVGAFAAGVMRWYTLAAMVGAYALVQRMLSSCFLRLEQHIHNALHWPFKQMKQRVLMPLRLRTALWRVQRSKKKQKIKQAKAKTETKSLQKTQKVLYNSKCL